MKPLGSDLTYKQFLFCEEYLRSYNARQAFKVAYPNCIHHGETNILKSRKVVNYIKARLDEKKMTIERLTDKAFNVLNKCLDDDSTFIALEATKQVARLNEVKARIDELLNKPSEIAPQNITLNVVKKDMDES